MSNERKKKKNKMMRNRLYEHLNKQYAGKENQNKNKLKKQKINNIIQIERKRAKEKNRSDFC